MFTSCFTDRQLFFLSMRRRRFLKFVGTRKIFFLLAILPVIYASWHLSKAVGEALTPPPPPDQILHHFRANRSLQHYIDNINLLIEPSLACERQVPVLILVTSTPSHQRHRDVIRTTWGKHQHTYFFLGLGLEEDQLVDAYVEAKQHSDLIVHELQDHYQNLTVKVALMLEWAARRCAHAEFVFKTDDDVLVNPWTLRDVLEDNKDAALIDHYQNLKVKVALMLEWAARRCPHAEFVFKTDDDVLVNPWTLRDVLEDNKDAALIGYKKENSRPHRDEYTKWYLPRWLYNEDLIPEYLSGTGYIINGKHLNAIFTASLHIPAINTEDVYFTYLVAKRALGLTLTHDRRLSPYKPWTGFTSAYRCLASIHSVSPEEMERIWPKIERGICTFRLFSSDLFLY